MIASLLMLAIGAPEVVAIPDDGPPWVELRFVLPGGSDEDPRDKSGIAHAASILLERRLAPLGARVHLGRKGIAIALGAPSANAEKSALDAIDAIAREATKVEADAAVKAAQEKRRRFADDDRALAEMELARALGAPEHSLGAPDELAKISREDLTDYQRRWWRGDQIFAVVSGRFDPETTKKISERLEKLQRVRPKKELKPEEPARAKPGLHVLVLDKPNRQRAHVAIGRRIDAIDPTIIAANAALGGSMSGRLTRSMQRTPFAGGYAFSTLREDHLVVWSSVKPQRSAAAIERILSTLAEVAKNGLDPEELSIGKRIAAAEAELSQRDAASRADRAVRAHLSAIDRAAEGAKFLELSDDAVKRAAQSLAGADGLAIVLVASVTPELQASLLAIPGVKEVQVARYDLR